MRALSLIGLDRVAGYFAHSALQRLPQPLAAHPASHAIAAAGRLAGAEGRARRSSSTCGTTPSGPSGHLPVAIHIPLGHLADRLSEIPKDQPLVTQCRSGGRSAIAASLLHRAGFTDVSNLAGGIEAWKAEGLPTAQ